MLKTGLGQWLLDEGGAPFFLPLHPEPPPQEQEPAAAAEPDAAAGSQQPEAKAAASKGAVPAKRDASAARQLPQQAEDAPSQQAVQAKADLPLAADEAALMEGRSVKLSSPKQPKLQSAVTRQAPVRGPREAASLLGQLLGSSADGAAAAGAAAPPPPVADWMVARIAAGEHGAERSLMHRFNAGSDFLREARSHSGEGSGGLLAPLMALVAGGGGGDSGSLLAPLVALAVWLRFSAARKLTWNRSYNIKPREISQAQAALATQLAGLAAGAAAAARGDGSGSLRGVALLALASVGRGGETDVGQRIRDEILVVQSRNGCKVRGLLEQGLRAG